MQQSINLFTKIERPKKEWLDAVLLLWVNGGVLGFFLLIALGIFLLGIFNGRQMENLRLEVQSLERELQTKRVARDRHLDSAGIDRQIVALESHLKLNQQVLNILQNKTSIEREPLSSYMQGLANQHLRGLWFTGFSVTQAGDTLSLSGQTTNPEFVPRYLKLLREEPVFAGKSFNIFQLQQDDDNAQLLNFVIQSADQRDAVVAEVITAPVVQAEQLP